MKLAVVIVTYNRLDLLKECFNACISQTFEFDKICIVNNASNDGTYEYLKSLEDFKNLDVINLEKNIGGAGGYYEGIKFLENFPVDYILLIDDDAIIDKNFNKNIVTFITNHSNDVIAYSGTVITNNEIQTSHRKHLLNYKKYQVKESLKQEYEEEYFDYELSSFCGLYIPQKIIDKIGLPNKDFFIWFDDTEYSLRIIKFGKIRNVNNAILNHKVVLRTTNKDEISWKNFYGQRNQLVTVKTHFEKKEYKKIIRKKKIEIFKFYIIWFFTKNKKYKFLYEIYQDALGDASNNNLGISSKYFPGMNFEE